MTVLPKISNPLKSLTMAEEEIETLKVQFVDKLDLLKEHQFKLIKNQYDDLNKSKQNAMQDPKSETAFLILNIIEELISNVVDQCFDKYDHLQTQSSSINLFCTETLPVCSETISNTDFQRDTGTKTNKLKSCDEGDGKSIENVSPSEQKVSSEIKELLRVTALACETLNKNVGSSSPRLPFNSMQVNTYNCNV